MDKNTNFNNRESLLEQWKYLEQNAEKHVQEGIIPYGKKKSSDRIN